MQPSRANEVHALIDSARNEHARGHFEHVLELLQEIRRIPPEQLNQELQYAFDVLLAGFAFDARDYDHALYVLSGVIDAPTASDNAPTPGVALATAHALKKLGDTTLAIEWYRHAELQIASEIVADINRNLAWLFAAQRQYDSAWARYHRSIQLREPREVSDINGSAWWHCIRGRLHLGSGMHALAYSEIDSAITLLEKYRTVFSRSETSVRRGLLTTVAGDIRFHTSADGKWRSLLLRMASILEHDDRRLEQSGLAHSTDSTEMFSSVAPFLAATAPRKIHPLHTFLRTTDATTDARGWLWLATLDGLYVAAGASMIPVASNAFDTRSPIRQIRTIDTALVITRYNRTHDTLPIADLSPQNAMGEPATLRSLTWRRARSGDTIPLAITNIPDSDSLLVVYPNGIATTRSLAEPHLIRALTLYGRPWNDTATCVVMLGRDSIVMGTSSGLWLTRRSSYSVERIMPTSDRGQFQSIENLYVLPDGNLAVSSAAVFTVILKRNDLRSIVWSGEESAALLHVASTLGTERTILRALDRMRTQRALTDIERIPHRLQETIGGSRKWRPSRSIALLTPSTACFSFPGVIGIADKSTQSITLHALPHEVARVTGPSPRLFRVNDSTIALCQSSMLLLGTLTQPQHRPGMMLLTVRTSDSSEHLVLSDGGTLRLPAHQRSIEIVVARPRAYGSISIPTTMRVPSLNRQVDVQYGVPVMLTGLPSGMNEVRISSIDIPHDIVLTIDIEQTMSETWWFWTGIGLLLVGFVVVVVLYLRQAARYRAAELERTAMRERAKISQDLHDAVGADLVRMTMILNRDDHDVPREELARIAREANRTLRDIIWTSRDQQTVDAVVAAIVERMRTIASEAGLEFVLDMPESIPQRPMKPEHIRDLVLIITECVTNIVKHANATVIRAYVHISPTTLHIGIADNGVGFQDLGTHNGMGLPGMRQRAARSGIALTIRSLPASGTEVELIMSFEGVA